MTFEAVGHQPTRDAGVVQVAAAEPVPSRQLSVNRVDWVTSRRLPANFPPPTRLLELLRRKEITALVDRVFPLEQAASGSAGVIEVPGREPCGKCEARPG